MEIVGRRKNMGGIHVRLWMDDHRRLAAKVGNAQAINDWLRGLINDDLEDSGDAPLRELPDYHGTYDGYTNHRCRCTACRTVKAEVQREHRSRRSVNA